MNVEIIDFTVPTCNRKNLFITNIPHVNEEDVYDKLFSTFSRFGLLHEVQIFPTKAKPGFNDKNNNSSGFYAFVKFYSYRDAANARQVLNEKLTIDEKTCKVVYAKRRKGDNQVTTLPLTKCYELAQHYLGFNGWSTKLIKLVEDKQTEDELGDLAKVKFYCKVYLELTNQDLSCEGIGVWEETYVKKDLSARACAMAKVRKICHSRAMQDAFSKLLVVSLSNGKVWVEVNTTLVDQQVLQQDQLDTQHLLQINELAEAPVEEEEEGEVTGDMDDVNLQILQELEDT